MRTLNGKPENAFLLANRTSVLSNTILPILSSKGRSMTPRKVVFLVVGVALLAAGPASAQEFFLKKGDVVVMMGDSITEQLLYSKYVEIWSQTRFPSYNLVFRNVGIGGDRSTGGNGRFKRDVLTHRPTVLTVDFGMNDGDYIWTGRTFKVKDPQTKELVEKKYTDADVEARVTTYLKGQQGIAEQAKAANIRVAWITPQPVEDKPGDEFEKYNGTLEKLSMGLKDLAKKNDGTFVDQFHPYWKVIEEARNKGEKGRITGGDRVHPGAPGQAVMAASILKDLRFPRLVSSAHIIVADKQGEFKNCKVSTIVITGDSDVRFTREDGALPFFPDQAKSILKYSPLLETMNEYGLKVTGLKQGKYEVKLGGKKVAEYTDAELAKGVNLAGPALTVGPVADQVKDIVKAIEAKTNFYHGKIYSPLVLGRSVNAKNPDFKDVAKEDFQKHRETLIAERMQKMPEYDAAIRKALEPRSHLVEIAPAK
jgi:lysophospholipase L1-like esterase